VLHVRKGYRGPSVTLSRTHPNLVKKLFAMEVPEIASGAVEIAAIAREAGHRSKIAVISHQQGVNAKGACIGPMGSRVRNVMTELHGEKIDIVDYSPDPAQFVAHALSPARVTKVHVIDLQARVAQVIVPDYQLSLAIGKEGQNARLAARLTGWRIDIRPDTGETGPAAASVVPDEAGGQAGGPAAGRARPAGARSAGQSGAAPDGRVAAGTDPAGPATGPAGPGAGSSAASGGAAAGEASAEAGTAPGAAEARAR
jgi:N utilization substance protein A